MPLKLRVETELDERSSTAAASKAQQVFEDAARNASRTWRQSFTDGMRPVEDAIKNVTKLEKELDDLRSRGAGTSAVAVQSQRVKDAKKAEADAVRDAAKAYDAASGSAALMEKALSGLAQGAGLSASAADNFGSAVSGIGTKTLLAATGIAAFGTAAVFAGKQLYDLGVQFDNMADGITAKTGIMGDQLNTMMSQVKDIGRNTAIPLEDIASISAGVAQSLHLSGDAAAAMTQKLADLQQITGQGVDMRGLGKAFRLFDVKDVQDQITALVSLRDASTATGQPINELIGSLQNSGKTAKEFGLSLGQTVGLLSTFEDGGLSAESAANGLSLALKNISKSGSTDVRQGLEDAITQIKRLHDAGDEAGAVNLANSTFGKSMKEFLPIIEDGTLDVTQLHDAIKNAGDDDSIKKAKDATADWQESWVRLKNTLEADVAPAAEKTFSIISDQITHVIWATDQLNSKLGNAFSHINDLINGPNLDTAANFGHPPPAGAIGPGGAGTPMPPPGLGGGALGGLLPGNTTGTWWGYQPPDTSKAPKGPRLGEAPSLPYDTTLPPGAANLPQTSAIVGAENSYLDARHALAEKQARLQQLEQDSNATANDIQKAKNDVLNAEQQQQQAELRLQDAAQNLYDQQNKQLNKYASDMGDIGAKLDKDFGISKGLAGVAENLFKFLADLAFAPALGAMRGAQAGLGYNPATGGQGLIGIAAAQGAFGPQFTPAAGAGVAPGGASSAVSGMQAVLAPGGGVSYMPQGGDYGASAGKPTVGPPDENSIRSWVQSNFGIPNTFGTGSWENAAHSYDGGWHHPGGAAQGYAFDFHGSQDQMANLANSVAQNYAQDTLELIYGGPGFNRGSEIKNGKFGDVYGADVNAQHTDHVHWAMTAPPYASDSATKGATAGDFSGFGAPGSQQAIANMVYQQAISRGYSPHEAQSILAYAIGESGLNAGISGGVQGGDEVIGLFQEKGAFAQAGGISPSQRGDPLANTSAYLNQLGRHRDLPIEQALPATSVGGPLASGPGAQPQAWGPLMAQAGNYIGAGGAGGPGGAGPLPTQGFGGTGMPFGLGVGAGIGMGGLAGGVGGAAGLGIGGAGAAAIGPGGIGGGLGTTLIGGLAPKQGTGAGGININSGILGAAAGAGAAGANMFAPGAGAAIQIGIQEASRAIQYGSQVAGIAVSGLQETFGFGKNSELAQNSWGSKILGGLVGAGVMLPNVAGSGAADKAKGLTPDQQAQQKAGEKGGQQLTPEQLAEQKKQGGGGVGQSAGKGNPVTNHFNIDNSGRTEAGTGRDAAWYINQQQAQYAPAAMP